MSQYCGWARQRSWEVRGVAGEREAVEVSENGEVIDGDAVPNCSGSFRTIVADAALGWEWASQKEVGGEHDILEFWESMRGRG